MVQYVPVVGRALWQCFPSQSGLQYRPAPGRCQQPLKTPDVKGTLWLLGLEKRCSEGGLLALPVPLWQREKAPPIAYLGRGVYTPPPTLLGVPHCGQGGSPPACGKGGESPILWQGAPPRPLVAMGDPPTLWQGGQSPSLWQGEESPTLPQCTAVQLCRPSCTLRVLSLW